MRALIGGKDYVCLRCLLREAGKRLFSSSAPLRVNDSSASLTAHPPPAGSPFPISPVRRTKPQTNSDARNVVPPPPPASSSIPILGRRNEKQIVRKCVGQTTTTTTTTRSRRARSHTKAKSRSKRKSSSASTQTTVLSPSQTKEAPSIARLHRRLQSGLQLERRGQGSSPTGLSLEQALKLSESGNETEPDGFLMQKLAISKSGQKAERALNDLEGPDLRLKVTDGIVSGNANTELHTSVQNGVRGLVPAPKTTSKVIAQGDTRPVNYAIAKLDESRMMSLDSRRLAVQALKIGEASVPKLSYGLRRVLFNQGVHQLQDHRTGVYNFDPYLQRIMPVSEFNFDALSEYVTSSEDEHLRELARVHGKKYVGSSSSMSGVLTHFHHLLSQFREINTQTLSRGFPEDSKKLTNIQKAPSAIFLRYKNGIYGIDADKEFDSANVLMSLGRSLEKLLTVPKENFERYRKSTTGANEEDLPDQTPEAYHYCEQGNFLLRSQLDAYDPNLPGTGMFDLKTRAVVSIRMNTSKPEDGVGYQLKSRFGQYESYEREYYDMIRAAFLKYTLQVRMGRMDGIFVAYHNVERIFGFQYMPLSEMDLHLHGQEDRSLGDAEFKLSIEFLNKILDAATAKFPNESLRFHFEARPGTPTKPAPYMYVFAEPLAETEVQRIQDSRKARIAEIQRRLLNPENAKIADADAVDANFLDSLSAASADLQEPEVVEAGLEEGVVTRPLLGLKLTTRNKHNGANVPRPVNFKDQDAWIVEYNMEEMGAELAERSYRACQARRKSVFDEREDNGAPNYYLNRLIELSRQGVAWSKKQDELHAQREVCVL